MNDDTFPDYTDWASLHFFQNLPDETIQQIYSNIDPSAPNVPQQIFEEFVHTFSKNMNWTKISTINYFTFSIPFLRKYQDKLNWTNISFIQPLSEDAIREFSNVVDWNYIGIRKLYSEPFIQEFAHKFNWSNVSLYQPLSNIFIANNLNKLNPHYLLQNSSISPSAKTYIQMFI